MIQSKTNRVLDWILEKSSSNSKKFVYNRSRFSSSRLRFFNAGSAEFPQIEDKYAESLFPVDQL
jgi:hypothetical protein